MTPLKMKTKRVLAKLGLYPKLAYLLQLPTLAKWLAGGCSAPPPQVVKAAVMMFHIRRYRLGFFVETGTYLGETLLHVSGTGIPCVSVELSEELHRRAQGLFSGRDNVSLLRGDSGEVMPRLLEKLDCPALFWLDGHYSGGITARGDRLTPIQAELEAIHDHFISDHVILIDDARCFDGSGYPHLDDLLRYVRARGKYRAEVSADIIRLVPRGELHPPP